ncbi:MAG: translocation/assembly module TamB, partial [Verrucomicrobiota bacterium]|nr:translocation/assembly module TamB [Verrucomicrobiota bacterium]
FNAAGVKGTVAGSLAMDWSGSGKLRSLENSGTMSLHFKKGRIADFTPLELDLDGKYSPEIIEIPDLRINTSKGILTASVDLHQQLLSISGISFQQGATGYFSGAITMPLDLQHGTDIDKLVPPDRPLSINLQSAELKLDALLKPAKGPAPIKGMIGATLDAQGTLDQLRATLQMKGRDLQATATKLAPATLDVAVTFADNRLDVAGAVQEPGIKPLEIRGFMPLPIRKILREKKIDDQTPIDLTVKLPQSPASFLGQVSPQLRFVEGQLGINAAVAGTIAHPQFYGSALLDLNAVRFRQQTMPAISGFKAQLEFKDNQLTLNRFGGEISGGTFSAAGKVEFVKLTEPTLDLQFKTANALLLRNDTVTLRADSDIKIAGPLNAAAVTGTLGLTKSRFFREVEILPLELPGRPAPKPPESAPGFSFEKPPLRDWTFDLAIKTKDPFVVRGNLTNGAVEVDLKLIGTGLSPTLDGTVRIEKFTASLPFSSLEINYGYVYFTPDNPFIPVLDIQGTSALRDYNINVYINGEASEPTTVFTSEPPLPQEEIIALLATGTTTAELTGNADVLAGRASVLLFQKFYRKIFKRKEPSENQSVTNRFQFDIGGVDPRTGKQEVSTRFKLSDNLYLIGDLDVQGEVRGQVKYLLRFR